MAQPEIMFITVTYRKSVPLIWSRCYSGCLRPVSTVAWQLQRSLTGYLMVLFQICTITTTKLRFYYRNILWF